MHQQLIYCHIAEIAIRSVHRNQGIGERLLRAAEDWEYGLGAEFASLEYHARQLVLSGAYGLSRGTHYSHKAATVEGVASSLSLELCSSVRTFGKWVDLA